MALPPSSDRVDWLLREPFTNVCPIFLAPEKEQLFLFGIELPGNVHGPADGVAGVVQTEQRLLYAIAVVPGCICANTKRPILLVAVDTETLFSTSLAVTVAPATAASCGSFTDPAMEPLVVCGKTLGASSPPQSARLNIRDGVDMAVTLSLEDYQVKW